MRKDLILLIKSKDYIKIALIHFAGITLLRWLPERATASLNASRYIIRDIYTPNLSIFSLLVKMC